MDWIDLGRDALSIVGLLAAVYGSGKGAKGAAAWLKRRRAERDARRKR